MKLAPLVLSLALIAFGCNSMTGNRVAAERGATPVELQTPFVPTLPTPNIVSGGVLNERALALPEPEYPAAARAANASGVVEVDIVVNEEGKVISVFAVKGHPLLRRAAEAAARRAMFAPTIVDGKAKKVSGVLKYTFGPK